ncbi:hypothetical protein LOZ66_000687 [Ophidiomyces ophidiicola]|nr:hypothetical protein LOZ66_000687 [Ophidiomyces ophidiicola]
MASKRKRTEAGGSAEMKVPETTITFTSRKPEWAYFHLELVTQPSESSLEFLDLLTAKTYLTSALSQFLGLSGTVIPIDILKLQTEELPTSPTVVLKRKTRNMLWIRVPHEDAAAVTAAVIFHLYRNRSAYRVFGFLKRELIVSLVDESAFETLASSFMRMAQVCHLENQDMDA